MKHPFQVGDLVRSRDNRTSFAIVTKARTNDKELYVDVVWLHTGKQVSWYSISVFDLVSRTER